MEYSVFPPPHVSPSDEGHAGLSPNIEPQLTFDWGRPNLLNFETFFDVSDKGMIHHLKTVLHRPDRLVYLWGPKGSGRTHLLQATCQLAGVRNRSAIYLSFADVRSSHPSMLDELDQMDLVCVDDVHALAGNQPWQEALFHLFNRCLASGTAMVFAAKTPPVELPIELPDLKSRLGSCVVYRIETLSDDEKIDCIKRRGAMLGLEMNNAIVDFLMQRGSRELTDLVEMVEILDKGSMAAKRKLTIPLVKAIFGW